MSRRDGSRPRIFLINGCAVELTEENTNATTDSVGIKGGQGKKKMKKKRAARRKNNLHCLWPGNIKVPACGQIDATRYYKTRLNCSTRRRRRDEITSSY